MTAPEILAALRKKYPSPAFSVQAEVRNGTGGYGNRSMDALVMALWPSRGLELLGFEIKVSRQDWLHERATPAKAEAFYEAVDLWYVITPPDLIQPGELPKTWGWMTVDGKGIKVQVPAENRLPAKTRQLPAGFDRLQLAGILRRLDNDYVAKSTLSAETEATRKSMQEQARRELKWEAAEYERLKTCVAAFEKASGLSIAAGWNKPAEVGRAVRMVLSSGPQTQRRQLQGHIDFLRQQIKDAEAYLESHE